MAYGKGARKDDERRMIALGSMPTDQAWLGLRDAYFHTANAIAAAVRVPLLDDLPKGKELDALMLKAQAGLKDGINSVWCEKARLAAKGAIVERHKRGRGNLSGRLKHVDADGDEPMADGTRRLVNLPEEWSRRLSDADVAALKAVAASLDFAGAMALLRKARDGRLNLPPLQVEALLALVDAAEDKFRHPTWGRDPQAVAQLHLDYRCISAKGQGGNREAWAALQKTLTEAMRQVAAG